MEDDEFTIKLDVNIEVETVVRNRFEEFEDMCNDDPFGNLLAISVSSDDEQCETSGESSQASVEGKDMDNIANVESDIAASENYGSPSDISGETTDSMTYSSPTTHRDTIEQRCPLDEDIVEHQLQLVNCTESIVFCIDMSTDMTNTPYVVTEKAVHSPLSMVKRAIRMFVHNKHAIDKKHEYALMIMYSAASWVSEFTSDPNQFIDSLDSITDTLKCNSCNISSISSLLVEKYPFILSTQFLPADVHRVFRVILIYGRSHCIPKISESSASIFVDYPSLFLDIVYVHEPTNEDNKCEEIYEVLCNLDDKDRSYIFETTRSKTKLHSIMAKLLSHPFQRAPQKDTDYSFVYACPDIQAPFDFAGPSTLVDKGVSCPSSDEKEEG